MEQQKICTKCEKLKDFSQFFNYSRSKDKKSWQCKDCLKTYPCNNGDQRKKNSRRYYEKNKIDVNKRRIAREFGITLEDYNQMLEKQKNCCAICHTHCKELNQKLAIDHCHTTGKIRGLLCGNCNTGLGQFKDSENNLLEAINYLRTSKDG